MPALRAACATYGCTSHASNAAPEDTCLMAAMRIARGRKLQYTQSRSGHSYLTQQAQGGLTTIVAQSPLQRKQHIYQLLAIVDRKWSRKQE